MSDSPRWDALSTKGIEAVKHAEETNLATAQEVPEDAPYSIITRHERVFLIILLSLIGFWSTIANTIYFPALPVLSSAFHVSESVMNLSLVAYLVFQGVVPTVSSNLADNYGRRPVTLACLLVFFAACIGLSQCNAFWLLAVLRCIQAAGIAPTIAINSGIGGDVTTKAERGGFVGLVSGAQLMGNAFGGLIGLGIMDGFDWRAIFIFLAIGSAATFLLAALGLVETNRAIVGNGSIRPKYLVHRAPVLHLPAVRKRLINSFETLQPKGELDMLAPLWVMRDPLVVAVLLACGFQFAAWTMALTSISTVLEASYNYSVMQVGYVYLPQGVMMFASSMATGKFLNWYYRRKRRQFDAEFGHLAPYLQPQFNIYQTRLVLLWPMFFIMNAGLLIFGWCLQYKCHIASIVILSMMLSTANSCFIAAGTTMLVDLNPSKGSTLTSCMNLFRCLLAAAGSGALTKMTDTIGVGGCYTIMAGFCTLSFAFLLALVISRGRMLKLGAGKEEV